MSPRILTLVSLGATLACGPAVSLPGSGDNSTGGDVPPGGSTSPSDTSSVPPNPTSPPNPDPPPQTSTDPYDPTTGGSDGSGSSGGCGFLCESTGNTTPDCDTFLQDCPEGEKCTPWANDGGNSWNARRCTPVVDDPDGTGEPCTVEGSATSGLDSCELGSMCWDVDTETKTGTCTPLCTGSPQAPSCSDPDRWCSMSGDGPLALCLPTCDPLESSCPQGQGCYPLDSLFLCAPDASGKAGGPFEACQFTNACDPGVVCVPGESTVACDEPSCCSPYCDLQAPDCPDTMVCFPWYEEGTLPPGGNPNVGYCTDPDWDGG